MKPTLQNLKRAAVKAGCTVECDSAGRRTVYQVCAPAGKIFACGQKHIMADWVAGCGKTDSGQAIADALEILKHNPLRDLTEQEKFECDEE